ncbi:beta strand repeat-containing protein [Nostoc sp.]|uniref:beta strand repeat-containing protein n=1 Tax=Nostoc sp. TaxID=1180 RepID=UPI002FF5F3C3
MATIIGTNGNDSLMGSGSLDLLRFGQVSDTLTGGGGNDTFYDLSLFTSTITDFGGVGKGTNPTAAVIAEVDTLKFDKDDAYTPENLLLTQNGSNLEITFAVEFKFSAKVILQNFALENLDNLSKSTGATVDLGNILFYGQTTITDSFDVFNANSTQRTIFNKNTVTFLNDLSNNVKGFDNSDDAINGEGGDDIIDGLSGNDLLRGGAGNNTLNGGTGDDTLQVDSPSGNNLLNGGDGNDFLTASGSKYYDYYHGEGDDRSLGNNTLNGGAGNDTLSASGSLGDNLLDGGDGNDSLSITGSASSYDYGSSDSRSLGNNTLNGGAGNDTLSAKYSTGDNLLNGGDGNDSLDISGSFEFSVDSGSDSRSSGNNTLNGGAGDDKLSASGSKGNNLLNGGDGNDFLDVSGSDEFAPGFISDSSSSGNNTLNGGAGDDTLSATGSTGDNLLDGGDGNDSIYVGSQSFVLDPPAPFSLVTQVDGGKGDDLLSVNYSAATAGITSTFNATTNIGSITGGKNRVNYKNIERLNILGTAYNDNIVGNSENDTLSTGSAGKDTIDGGQGDDVLSVDYSGATGGVTSTFNATSNIGSITAGTSSVSYKNIERFNISGTAYNDNIVGQDGNDTLSTGSAGKDTIDGGKGDDLLSVGYSGATGGITSTFNATTNIGSITAGTNRVNYKNIERLNISGTGYNDQIVGNSGNDTLSGRGGNDTLTGGAGNDTFVYISYYYNDNFYSGGTDTITDFGGVGKGSNPSATVIDSLDTLQFTGKFTDSLFTAQNLQLTQNGNNLEITFGDVANGKVILQDFKLENLDNLPATSSRPAIGNILFYGQTSITDSFDVFDANSTQTSLFNRNTVTFLNDLSNNITGFDNSNDVINGQGGDDIIDGLSGNDILRGDAGNDTLIGGAGNDTLESSAGNDSLDGGTGDDNLSATGSRGDNTFNGGAGNDSLSASNSTGNNTLNGGEGNDSLNVSGFRGDNLLSGGDGNDFLYWNGFSNFGNNTLNGGAGDDTLNGETSTGDNLLSGGEGNDYIDISADYNSTGNNTLNGGAGDDTLNARSSTGNNLLSGGDGNDILRGGNGNDSLYGGNGTDTFAFYNYNQGVDTAVDTIYDFNATNELIQVSSYPFGGGLSVGSLQKSQFTLGTSATTSNQRFIYDFITGGLYFDQDGNGAGFTQVKLAQLSAGLSLTNNNFVVFNRG